MKKRASAILAASVLIIAGCSQGSPGGQPSPGGGPVDDPLSAVSRRELVGVPGGAYVQHDTYASQFSHEVTDFRIAKYEVTYELWYEVREWAENNGYSFGNKGLEGSITGGGTYPLYTNVGKAPSGSGHQPATMVNWRDCVAWCNAYSEMTGLAPCFTVDGAVLRDSRDSNGGNCDRAACDWTASGYRLPSEGEWQYAASYLGGGLFERFDWASGATDVYTDKAASGVVAWYSENAGGATHDVGAKASNGLGIFDMSGNADEWVWDIEGSYPDHAVKDFRGGDYHLYLDRVLRGGMYSEYEYYLQVGLRDYVKPWAADFDRGFRVARRAG